MKLEFVQRSAREGVGIRGLSVASEGAVWASGTGGHFARIVGEGAAWEWARVPGHEDLDFRTLKAFSDTCAILMNAGPPATILKTTDGGRAWKLTFRDESGKVFFDSAAFWDTRSGVALSDPLEDGCCMLRTADGGDSWERIPVEGLPRMMEGESCFAASGSCIAAFGSGGLCFVSGGRAARAFLSLDRGKSWRMESLPIMRGTASQGAFSIAAINDGGAFCVVGGDYKKPEGNVDTAAYSRDGGLSWRAAEVFPPSGYNSCVASLLGTGGERLLACGTQGSHLSEDGGKTWSMVDREPFHVVAFEKTGACGWAAGSDGRIAKILARD
jgi:photosystem II stability/assembly factor-like uncharacterized protein